MTLVQFASDDHRPKSATEKTQLIATALDSLRAAQSLDEREDLDASSWIAWYDATIPQVRDLKILAGAMEVELQRRRGEEMVAENEQRGRPPENATQRVAFSKAATMQRSRARVLAKKPERVTSYIQQQAAAGHVPTVRGAIRAVKASAPESPKRTRHEVRQARVHRKVLDWINKLDGLADGERRTDAQLARTIGVEAGYFLEMIRFIPWLAIDRTGAGTVFRIDQELHAICDGRMPRPALGHQSIRAYLETLRHEIARRRKENHDEFRKRKWNSELILKREQTVLLDWIEEQLMKVPT